MKELMKNYRHAIPALIYFPLYLLWFEYIEKFKYVSEFKVIHTALDDKIPFCEFFVIPYFIWFGFIAWILFYTLIMDREGYYRVFTFLAVGMTIFLIISTISPNCHHLRPETMPRDNVFSHIVSFLYSIDTPTNLWPSIHVYDSLVVYFAVRHDERLGKNWKSKYLCLFITIMIILSTLFLKQHSVFDVATGFIMAAVFYVPIYKMDVLKFFRKVEVRETAEANS